MKNLLKKKFKQVSLLTLSLGFCAGLSTASVQNSRAENVLDSGSHFLVRENGVRMAQVGNVTNADGSVTQTYSYTVVPENATTQDVEASVSFIESSDNCSSFVTASVDCDSKTVSITCHQAFDKRIQVVLKSVRYPDKIATIQVDYVKKLLSLKRADVDKTLFIDDINREVDGYYDKKSKLYAYQYLTQEYSIFTVNKEYNFTYDITDSVFEIPKAIEPITHYNPNYQDLSMDREDSSASTLTQFNPDKMIDTEKRLYEQYVFWTDPLKNLIVNALQTNTYPTAQEIWDVNNTKAWHSYLEKSKRATDMFCQIHVLMDFNCVEDSSKKVKNADEKFLFYLPDYTFFAKQIVQVGSIAVDDRLSF